MDAIVTAGGIPQPGDPLYSFSNGSSKALIDVAGKPMVQWVRNFRFFDAPVALVVIIERDFGAGGYMDLGMCLHGLMLAAQAQGLASCAIGALASYPQIVRAALGLPESEAVVCGLALGWEDPHAPVNRTRTEREPLARYFSVLR